MKYVVSGWLVFIIIIVSQAISDTWLSGWIGGIILTSIQFLLLTNTRS